MARMTVNRRLAGDAAARVTDPPLTAASRAEGGDAASGVVQGPHTTVQRAAIDDLRSAPRLSAQRQQMHGLVGTPPVQRMLMDGKNPEKDDRFKVEISRHKRVQDPEQEEGVLVKQELTPTGPITVGDLKKMEPQDLFSTLRGTEKTNRLAPKSEHQITSFSVRKPTGKSGHWAMYFVVERRDKGNKSLKVDLYERGYRVIYQDESTPHSGFEGDVEWYGVTALPVAKVYQYLSAVAVEQGAYGELGKYDCHAFVELMLKRLEPHQVHQTKTEVMNQGKVLKEISHL